MHTFQILSNRWKVSVLVLSAVDLGFEPRSGKHNDYKIGMCYFSAKHAALKKKSKDWLDRNQDNVSEWGGMYIRGLLFLWASTIKINKAYWSSTKRSFASFHW
jgi:hypothetical protein